jgi:hypothetical protein
MEYVESITYVGLYPDNSLITNALSKDIFKQQCSST